MCRATRNTCRATRATCRAHWVGPVRGGARWSVAQRVCCTGRAGDAEADGARTRLQLTLMDDQEQLRVDVDGVIYSLHEAPPENSPLVARQLSTLPTDIPLLSPLVAQLSRHVVALSDFDAVQKAFTQLLTQVGDFDPTRCLRRVRDACESVLMQQMLTLQMITASPFQNESLAHFSGVALTLARSLLDTVSRLHRVTRCLSTLSTALHETHHALNSTLHTKQQLSTTWRVKNVSIMQQQSQLLHSLSEYAAQYSQLQASQQRLSRRQTLCSLFSFVPSIDQSLQNSYNLHLFQPVSNMIHTVNHQYNQTQLEQQQLLTLKREQRERNKSLLDEHAECERQIKLLQQQIQQCHQHVKHVTDAIQLIQTLAVRNLRIITAFKSIAHSCQTLSSSQLSTLIDLTCPSSATSSSSSIQQAHACELDASQPSVQPTWTMKTAVKQKFVHYYAQWAALKHCCQSCLQPLSQEQQTMVPQLCWETFDSNACESSLHASSSAVTERQQSSPTIEPRDAEHLSVASS